MKTIKCLLILIMVASSLSLAAQSKRDMPFSSSSENANKLVRKSWAAFSDSKMKEGNDYVHQALKEDPDHGIALVSLFTLDTAEQVANLRRAENMKLSEDEKLLIEGIKASRGKEPTVKYFEPLLKKYPSDDYLHLLIMFRTVDKERMIKIGENIIRRNSKFAPAYNLLGYTYMRLDNLEKAEANFDKYISLRPDLANVYDSKADYMMRVGKIEEAISLYEKAAGLGMEESNARAERAMAMLKYPEPSEDEVSKIREMIVASHKAHEKSDIEGILKPYADQAIDIIKNQTADVGIPNMKKRLQAMFGYGTRPKNDVVIEMIKGAGPVAVAYGPSQAVWIPNSGKEKQGKEKVICLLHKQPDSEWKIVAKHVYGIGEDAALSAADRAKINELFDSWSAFANPDGVVISENQMEAYSSLYSAQAIEISPDLTSNIGIANLRARWDGYNNRRMESRPLGVLGVEGSGSGAFAWGVGTQNFYLPGSTELIKARFPWVMVLKKESDDAWRILVWHWVFDRVQ